MQVVAKSAKETFLLGEKLSKYLSKGDIIALEGELGAGKTVLIQGICSGLEVKDTVSSPSYVLINEYSGKMPVYHFDVYRIENLNQIIDLGYEEYFKSEGIVLIEWAEKMENLITFEYLKIKLKYDLKENQRIINFIAFGKRFEKIIEQFRKEILI